MLLDILLFELEYYSSTDQKADASMANHLGLKGLDKVLEGWFLLEMGGLAVVLSRHGGLLFGLQSHYLLD